MSDFQYVMNYSEKYWQYLVVKYINGFMNEAEALDFEILLTNKELNYILALKDEWNLKKSEA